MSSNGQAKRVCVVGAGVSGLVALKECLVEGLQPTCYELDTDIGGIWCPKTEGKSSNTPQVWETLITNTSKYMMTFSDFPPLPEDTPIFTAEALRNYYKRYAQHFQLSSYIKLNTRVIKIQKASDHNVTGHWKVLTCPTQDFRGGDKSAGQVATEEDLSRCSSEIFDFVLICSGCFKKPYYPTVAGLNTFPGDIQHSFDYKMGSIYNNKNVLVIGSAFSAGDIANDIAAHTKVCLSRGKGTWIFPRIMSGARPSDLCLPRCWYYSSTPEVYLNNFTIDQCQNRLDHMGSAICPINPPASSSSFMFGDEIYMKIMSGRIKVYGELERLKGSSAYFSDGSVIPDLDAVILCTGYSSDFSFLDYEIIQENGKMDLFKLIFPIQEEKRTLGIIGAMAGDSALAPVFELQSRYAVKVFAGKLQLPSVEDMKADADFWSGFCLKKKGRYCYMIPGFLFGDAIAKLLGCFPSFWHLLLRDPALAFRAWYGPIYPAQYRLLGPDSNWRQASEICRRADAEGSKPLRHGTVNKVKRDDLAAARRGRLMNAGLLLPVFALALYLFHSKHTKM
ncbi:unnamed protein product [Lymnaea stagnalis]|uniref:Flavin-containing monooxygenase n=1 Tax=Lymnaea stagnalis TaxID=6523 RepID=A0AAV2GZE1_LYMST